MKQLIAISGILFLTLGLPSCYNDDWSFPDFDYTTTYFPYQYPLRTLVLGDYMYDNSKDKELKFMISARMGGVYKNGKNIAVEFAVTPSLTDSLYSSTGIKLKALPTSLYSLSSASSITIPSGKFDGGIEVTLTDAFLDDPLAISLNYVIPLKITSSTTDSVLVGNTIITNADPRIAGEWIVVPKNFTLFGIKFVNQYDGKYLLRGTDVRRNAGGFALDTISYRNKYVERCEVVSLLTASRNGITYQNSVRSKTGSPGTFKMNLPFDASGNAVITKVTGSSFDMTGSAKFVKDGDEWGGSKRDAIYLDYVITEGTNFHNIKDTLVFRDKAVTFGSYSAIIKKAP